MNNLLLHVNHHNGTLPLMYEPGLQFYPETLTLHHRRLSAIADVRVGLSLLRQPGPALEGLPRLRCVPHTALSTENLAGIVVAFESMLLLEMEPDP